MTPVLDFDTQEWVVSGSRQPSLLISSLPFSLQGILTIVFTAAYPDVYFNTLPLPVSPSPLFLFLYRALFSSPSRCERRPPLANKPAWMSV